MDYKIDVNGVVSTYHANMLKQYVERRNELSHCLLSAEVFESVYSDDIEDFPLDDCTFPKPESFRDVSITNTLTSEQRKEVETLMKQYPDVLSSLPGRTDQIQHDIKLLTSEPIRTKGYSIPYRRVASWKRIVTSDLIRMCVFGSALYHCHNWREGFVPLYCMHLQSSTVL